MRETFEKLEKLADFLYGEALERSIKLNEFNENFDIAEPVDREQEIKVIVNDNELLNVSEEVLQERIEEIENDIRGLISFDPKYLTMEELLSVNEMIYDLEKYQTYYNISKSIQGDLEKKSDRSIYAWNVYSKRYERLLYDEEDYARLRNLNIIKKLYEKDGWIYKLYFLDSNLHLKPLDNYLLENEDYTMICICRNGNILDLQKDNWYLVKHPLLQREVVEEIESAKKVGQWLNENYGGTEGEEKLYQEILAEAEQKAKEVKGLLDEAEGILEIEGDETDGE